MTKPLTKRIHIVSPPKEIPFLECLHTLCKGLGWHRAGRIPFKDLIRAIKVYLAQKDPAFDRPRFSETKAELEEIRDLAKKLSNKLENLDIKTEACLQRWLKDADWDQPIYEVTRLYAAASTAANQVPEDRGGPKPKNKPLSLFIVKLADIYQKTTDKKATRPHDRMRKGPEGPFFRFFCNILNVIDPSLEPTRIATIIDSVLKKRG